MKRPCRNASQTSIIKMRELHPIPLKSFNWIKKNILALLLISLFTTPTAIMANGVQEHIGKETYQIDKIYPNPVKELVYVELYSENYSNVMFELIDILGNKAKIWKKIELVPGTQRIKLDTNDLNNGFYLLKATINKQVIVKRIRKL